MNPFSLFIAGLSLSAVTRLAAAQCPDGSPPPCRSQPVARFASAPPPAPTSVAVLPFQNRSPDSTDAYLAEGMTEEVGNRLTQLGRLQVKARGLVEAQWRRTPDPFDAARRLNVAWFVHGSVRHAGTQLLVNVELVRTTTGEEVWASRFPRRDADVFAVQAEVAESERLGSPRDSVTRALYATALGDSTAARAQLARFRAIADSVPQANATVARWSTALGMRSEALAALERYRAVVNPREPKCTPTTTCSVSLETWRLLHDPILAPLRNEARFVRLLEETRPRVPWR